MRRFPVVASVALLLALLIVLGKESQRFNPVRLIPRVTGQPEYCLTCHADLAPISTSHPVEGLGCVRCHGGERLALDADLAHSTLRGGSNPSDPAVVEMSCGGADCHSGKAEADRDHIQRITSSLHTTYAGTIAAVREAAGIQSESSMPLGLVAASDPNPITSTTLSHLQAFDPAQVTGTPLQAFVQNCLTCHLAAQPRSGLASSRLTGCAACHTSTANSDPNKLVHRLSTAIGYEQCNTCHNRGTYDLHTMDFQPRTDQPTDRLHSYYLPGTQTATCELRLDCVDCHTRQEIMGDGHLYGTLHTSPSIQCRTCHGTVSEPPLTYTITQPTDLALRLAALNPAIRLQTGDTLISTAQGEPLWNTRRQPDGSFEIIGKVTGQHQRLPLVQGSGCRQNPTQQEARDCHACHSAQNQ